MKRKLNEEDAPVPVAAPVSKPTESQSFDSLGLDIRLLQAINREKFTTPTPVQSKAIPLALGGKDILGNWT